MSEWHTQNGWAVVRKGRMGIWWLIKLTRKTSEGRSATFRNQDLDVFFWPQLLHDFLKHFFLKINFLSRLGWYLLEVSFSFCFLSLFFIIIIFFIIFLIFSVFFFNFHRFFSLVFLFFFFFFFACVSLLIFCFFWDSFYSDKSKVTRVTVGRFRPIDQSFRACKVNLVSEPKGRNQ